MTSYAEESGDAAWLQKRLAAEMPDKTPEEIEKRNAMRMKARERAILRIQEKILNGDIRPTVRKPPQMSEDMQRRYDAMGEELRRAHRKMRQRRAEAAAVLLVRVAGSLVADDALRREVDALVGAFALPGAHPRAVAPAVGAEQRHPLALQRPGAGIPQRLEFIFLQHLVALGGAAPAQRVELADLVRAELRRGEDADLRSGAAGALRHGGGHGLGVAGAAPEYNSSFHD